MSITYNPYVVSIVMRNYTDTAVATCKRIQAMVLFSYMEFNVIMKLLYSPYYQNIFLSCVKHKMIAKSQIVIAFKTFVK